MEPKRLLCFRRNLRYKVKIEYWICGVGEYHIVWYKNREAHRDGGKPAIFGADGTRWWYQYDERHREDDKPAAIWADGSQVWYQRGEFHRNHDRPAIIGADGTRVWYLDNEQYTP